MQKLEVMKVNNNNFHKCGITVQISASRIIHTSSILNNTLTSFVCQISLKISNEIIDHQQILSHERGFYTVRTKKRINCASH